MSHDDDERHETDLAKITPREALIRARSALLTCFRDTAADLAMPERSSVLELRIAEIDAVLARMSGG
jgi:hypothetical protein